jgi:hypothetical protein
MKRNVQLTLLLIAALLIISPGCKKSSSSSSSNTGPFFKGTVGGSAFTADTVAAGHFANGDYYEVVGFHKVNGDSLILAVAWPDTVQVGKPYTFASAEVGYTSATDNFLGEEGVGHGTFTLTALDNTNMRVAGSFSGVLYDYYNIDSITVTNAQFNANFLNY